MKRKYGKRWRFSWLLLEWSLDQRVRPVSKSWNQTAFVKAIRTIYAFNWLFRKRKMFGFWHQKAIARLRSSTERIRRETTRNTRITSEILIKSEHSLTSFLKKHFLIIFSEILIFWRISFLTDVDLISQSSHLFTKYV